MRMASFSLLLGCSNWKSNLLLRTHVAAVHGQLATRLAGVERLRTALSLASAPSLLLLVVLLCPHSHLTFTFSSLARSLAIVRLSLTLARCQSVSQSLPLPH
jgi:hypothetical protein